MPSRLSKAETVALWHAIKWMELCLKQPAKDDDEAVALEVERARLKLAKQALRKVNAIRCESIEPTKAVREQKHG